MRNSGATSQNSVLFSARPFCIRDIVRPCRIQLLYVLHRSSCKATRLGMPPFVLCVSANCMSTDRTDRSEDGGSQAERAVALRREISNDCTKSRLHHTAWEVMGLKDFLRKSYVAPDFRLHPSSEIGSLIFCQLG